MADLDELRPDTFRPHLDTVFTIQFADAAVPLTLVGVEAYGPRPGAPRAEGFSLYFKGEPGVTLVQSMYSLDHEALGRLDLFIVPVQPESDGLPCYQAVFN
ncbi:MAG TPA: hypothetical protein VGO92_04480 [Acidimicrobiales bacterium]|nr:hypothetical protein [Acidimicrobiales bacterium]